TDIERMIAEAEKFKTQDEQMRKKVDAKNDLENACFSVKNQLESNGATNDDITTKIKEVTTWLESHPNEEAEVYEERKKELMNFVQQHAQNSAPNSTNAPGPTASTGPNIEEVD